MSGVDVHTGSVVEDEIVAAALPLGMIGEENRDGLTSLQVVDGGQRQPLARCRIGCAVLFIRADAGVEDAGGLLQLSLDIKKNGDEQGLVAEARRLK